MRLPGETCAGGKCPRPQEHLRSLIQDGRGLTEHGYEVGRTDLEREDKCSKFL